MKNKSDKIPKIENFIYEEETLYIKNKKELIDAKNKIQKEIKEMKKERLFYAFLNILKPSYPANLAASAQLFGYIGIIVSLMSLSIGNVECLANYATLGIFTGFTASLTAFAYDTYEYKEYLLKKMKELDIIDTEIYNLDEKMNNSKSKTNFNVNSFSKNNITTKDKSTSDKISELKKYKEKVINENESQVKEKVYKKK